MKMIEIQQSQRKLQNRERKRKPLKGFQQKPLQKRFPKGLLLPVRWFPDTTGVRWC